MSNQRQIKQRIGTAGNVAKITKAMEMVSASKMRKAQERALSARSYAHALRESLATLSDKVDPRLHPLLQPHETGVDVAVIISTDRGLCGNLNQNLLRELVAWIKPRSNAKIIAVGKKAISFANFYGLALHAQFDSIPDNFTASDLVGVTTLVLDGFISQEFKSVELFFMDFVNTLTQKTSQIKLLPLEKTSDQPDSGVYSKAAGKAEYLFEPSAKEILNNLLPFYVENLIYQAFLESKASEHSARMVTMKNASENANELMSELQLEYNKSRQASITSELLDITTATLSLST